MADSIDFSLPVFDWVKKEIAPSYREYLELVEQASNDPENEPFRSFYLAREKLVMMYDKIDHNSNKFPGCVKETMSLLVLVNCLLGVNYLNSEEFSQGQKKLEEVLIQSERISCKDMIAHPLVTAFINLGILWSNRDEHEGSLKCLLKAKEIHDTVHVVPPLDKDWLLGEMRDVNVREKEFEDQHTHTLFYIAQVYAHLKEPKLSAEYCQITLSRQLETKLFDSIEWSLNAATLSQYYINVQNFPQARHCLAAASVVLSRFNTDEGSLDDAVLKEKFERTLADISRCWIKYCLSLLTKSCDHQSSDVVIEAVDIVHRFEPLELSEVEKEVSCVIAEGYPAARLIFLHGQRHIMKAKAYFNLEEHASDNAAIVQDHSQLFACLTFFESDLSLKCRLNKRRIDMLVALINELNPQHYMVIVRQIIYETAEIYSEMGNLKVILAEAENNSHQRIVKINSLYSNAMLYYEKYINSFTGPVDSVYLRSYLLCKLNMCRLHAKLLFGSLMDEIKHLEMALEGYGWLVKYADDHANEVNEVFKEEMKLCKEMMDLLPMRIDLAKLKIQ